MSTCIFRAREGWREGSLLASVTALLPASLGGCNNLPTAEITIWLKPCLVNFGMHAIARGARRARPWIEQLCVDEMALTDPSRNTDQGV